MKMNEYIEKAERKAGKQIELAKILGISDGYIRMVKAEKRCFSNDICIKLADYIGADRLEVIAASSLVTEKDEEKRKIFESCFSRAASIVIASSVISILTLSPQAPAHADFLKPTVNNTNYWQLTRRKKIRRKSDFLAAFFDKLLNVSQHKYCAD